MSSRYMHVFLVWYFSTDISIGVLQSCALFPFEEASCSSHSILQLVRLCSGSPKDQFEHTEDKGVMYITKLLLMLLLDRPTKAMQCVDIAIVWCWSPATSED